MKHYSILSFLCALAVAASMTSAGSKVSFNAQGNTIVNGKPFFPIGIYVYDLSDDVMKDIKSKHFNVVIGNGSHASLRSARGDDRR